MADPHEFHRHVQEREFMTSLEALVTLLLNIGEERMARRLGFVWMALGELIGRGASNAEKAAHTITLREVYEEPPGVMRLRIHPASAELIEEANTLNEQLEGLRNRVWEMSMMYDSEKGQ
jgi:hypothetical protein